MFATDIKQALLIIEQYPYGAVFIGVLGIVFYSFGELLVVLFSKHVWPLLRRKFKLDETKDGEN